MSSITDRLWPTLARALVGALAIGAVAASLAGSRPIPRPCELVGGHVVGDSVDKAARGDAEGRPYDLVLSSVSPRRAGSNWMIGCDEDGSPVFGGSRLTRYPDHREVEAIALDSAGRTLGAAQNEWFVAPAARGCAAPLAVLWRMGVRYVPASPRHSSDAAYLFEWNYSHDLKLMHTDLVERAVEAAARGESLVRSCSLVAASPEGREVTIAPMSPLYNAEYGLSFVRSGRMELIARADGSYQNSDMLYLVTNQPRLEASKSLQLRRTDDIGGNYRGCFCVDLETGRQLWDHPTGASIVAGRAVNLNEDEEYEYVMSCYGSENGVSGGGMTDAGCTYVFCLDRWGHFLWRHRFCGVFPGTSCCVCDLDGRGEAEVAVGVASSSFEKLGSLNVLSGWGESVSSRSGSGGVYGLVPFDVDGDGREEIVGGLPDSLICAFDKDLNVIASYEDTEPIRRRRRSELAPALDLTHATRWERRLTPLISGDIDGDSVPELILLSQASWDDVWEPSGRALFHGDQSHIVVLGRRFSEEARCVLNFGDASGIDFIDDPPASMKTTIPLLRAPGEGPELALSFEHLLAFDVEERE